MYVCVCIGFIVLIYLLNVNVEHVCQQHIFTNNTQASVTVMIFIQQQLTPIHSDTVASPY